MTLGSSATASVLAFMIFVLQFCKGLFSISKFLHLGRQFLEFRLVGCRRRSCRNFARQR